MDNLVDCDWLEAHLDDNDLVVIDCGVRFQPPASATSGRADWSASHIPGSVFLDHFKLVNQETAVPLAAPRPEQLAKALGEVGVGNETSVVVHDRSDGIWAARLWWMIRAVGHSKVALLDGGWTAWTSSDKPTSSEPTPVIPAPLSVNRPLARFVDKSDVLAAIAEDDIAIVSALPPEVHERGDYGRPGRIPGSRCVPYTTLVDRDTNRLASVDDIRRQFDREFEASAVVTYCGGGVAASLAAFALTRAGHPDVAVYDGSMLEWCADPALPLEDA